MRLVSLIPTILRNKRRILNLPRSLTYLVTFRCNMRCIMCDSWKKDGTNDLTLDEIRSIFSKLPKMDVVRLTGGEHFLQQDLLDITHAMQAVLKPIEIFFYRSSK